MDRVGVESYDGLLERVLRIINEQTAYPERSALICLLIYVLVERKVVPGLILDQIETPTPSKPHLYAATAEHLPHLLESVASREHLVVKLEMTLLNTSRFLLLIANYGRPDAFKVTLTNGVISVNTCSLVYDMRKFICLSAEKRFEVSSEAMKEFSARTRNSLLGPILTEWHIHHCRLPSLVSESTPQIQAVHLKLAVEVLERSSNFSERDLLLLIISCVLSEREFIPRSIGDLIQSDNLQSFSYNKQLCDSVTRNSSAILSWAKEQKGSVLRLPVTHKNSELSFDILVARYGLSQYKVTFMQPPPSTGTLSATFDMKRCAVAKEDSSWEMQVNILKEYAKTISNELLYPILTIWWQQKELYTRLPYLLGIPENCLRKINGYLDGRSRKTFRLTSRQLKNVS